jgi:hypothetical protein
VSLVFQAFPGRAERDPYWGLPQWPKGPPARLEVKADPLRGDNGIDRSGLDSLAMGR